MKITLCSGLAALDDGFDELRDAAFVMEFLFFADALVLEADPQAGIEIGHLAQIACDQIIFEDDFFEDRRVGREGRFGSADFGDAAILDLGLRRAALVALVVEPPVLTNLDFEAAY